MHSKSDNIEIMINVKVDEVTKELFQSLLSRYQIGLKTSMKGSEFLYYKCHNNPNPVGSCIATPKLIKKNKQQQQQ